MSPWWSRPTAEDDPRDDAPEKGAEADEAYPGEEPGEGEARASAAAADRAEDDDERDLPDDTDEEGYDLEDEDEEDDYDEYDDEDDDDEEDDEDDEDDDDEEDDEDDEDDGSSRGSGRRRRRRRRGGGRSRSEESAGDRDSGARAKDSETSRTSRRRRRGRRGNGGDGKGKGDDGGRRGRSSGSRQQDSDTPSRRRGGNHKKSDSRDKKSDSRDRGRSNRGGGGNGHRHEDESEGSFDISPLEIEEMPREIVLSVPERNQSVNEELKIAMFCDLENIALGVRDSSEVKKFDINLVLERLLEKGKIIVKRAYCDWERYSEYKRAFHEAAIELIDIPQRYYSGKNSADIKMVVDAMDLSYSKEHLETFVLLSGDSDFSPLVSKLKENNKYVIGIGVKGSSANLLIDNCDEFIYYEDIWRSLKSGPKLEGLTKKQSEVFGLLVDSIQALTRENKDVLWGSMIKQTMQRKRPSFNEGYFGYSTFSELLEDAEQQQIVKLKKDQRSGSYIVTGFARRR